MLLHYFEGLKYEEIGEILNANINTVKVTVHRGRKMLKDIIVQRYPEILR
jgi:DNA-directed RNA polymerase specialized sigma24 family protein